MNRRPLGSIDPNSIRETELHTEFRRRHNRGERESTPRPGPHRKRDAARQRADATRRRETDVARAERLRANRQRKATRRQQETSQAREARCVRVSVLGCVYPCVYPSCTRWLLAKKFCCKRVFAASSSCIAQPTASYNVRLNLTDTTLQACCGQTTCCCGSAGRKECRCSLLPNLDALTAPESDEMV